MKSINRRELLSVLGMAGLAGAAAAPVAPAQEKQVNSPLNGLFNVREFGARGEGKVLESDALNRAVTACHKSGGGIVYVPPGTYLSGTVVLKSNVTLYLEAGATLLASKDIQDFAKQPGPEIKGDISNRHLIFARDAENVRLAGLGRIDGQGHAYWKENGRILDPKMAWRNVIAWQWSGVTERPSPLLEFFNCKNLHIEDVTIQNSPSWTLRPIHCDNVFIRGISIKNPVYGPNSDGIDPTCSQNVFISDCSIEVGDDAICLKSETYYGEQLRPTKNVTITGCIISGCCNAFKIGTRTLGAFENILFTNSVIYNEDVELSSRIISGVCLEVVDGGSIEGVLISNLRMQRARTPIFLKLGSRSRAHADGSPGTLRGVTIENVHASGCALTSSITGLPGFDVEDVTLANVRLESHEGGASEWSQREIPETAKLYPEAWNFGRLPSYGLFARHVSGLRLRGVEFKTAPKEERPAIWCEDVKSLEVSGLRCQQAGSALPVIKLVNNKQVTVQGCVAPRGTKVFLEAAGKETEKVVLVGNNLMNAETPVSHVDGAAEKNVSQIANAWVS